MTSKTKLLPQVENDKKIAFLDFMILITILSKTNAFFFCSDHGDKLVSSWRQVSLKKSRPQSNQIVLRSDEEAIVGVHV